MADDYDDDYYPLFGQKNVTYKVSKLIDHNIPKNYSDAMKEVKKSISNAAKPCGEVGLVSSIAYILDRLSDDKEDDFDAKAKFANAYTDTSEGLLRVGELMVANANLFEAEVGNKVFNAKFKLLEASARGEYGLNNSIGVDLTVVKGEVNVGPAKVGVGLNFDTSASIGVNGASVSVLGFGATIGPSLEIKTPFFDFKFKFF